MRSFRLIAPAALAAALFAFSPAPATAATPASPAMGLMQAIDTNIIEAQARPNRNRAAPNRARPHRAHPGPRYRHRYTPGGRYSSAPRGWRQYRARPGDWRTRGCIMVGPIWFCP